VLLWRRFAAQYSGEEISDSPAPAVARKREKRKIVAAERPGLFPPQLAAMVAKELHYLKRNGLFSFLTLVLPIVLVSFFTLQIGPGSAHPLTPRARGNGNSSG